MLNEKGFENKYNNLVVVGEQGDAQRCFKIALVKILISIYRPFLNTSIILDSPCSSEKVSGLPFHLTMADSLI